MLYTLKPTSILRRRTLGLTVPWQPRGEAFRESLAAYFSGVKPVKSLLSNAYFRDAYIRPYWPSRTFVFSLLCHAAMFYVLSLPIWKFAQPSSRLRPVRIEVTWNAPVEDLSPLTFPGSPAPPVKNSSASQAATGPGGTTNEGSPGPPGEPGKPLPRQGADAFHPRQTLLSTPQRPTHPRQTLIQPGAPPQPPKISGQMPNIVDLGSRSSRPRMFLRPSALGPLPRHPRRNVRIPPAPELRAPGSTLGQLNIAAGPLGSPEPRMPAASSTAPRYPVQPKMDVITAPNVQSPKSQPGQLGLAVNQPANSEPRIPSLPGSTPRLTAQPKTDPISAPNLQAPKTTPSQLDLGANQPANARPGVPAETGAAPRQSAQPKPEASTAPSVGATANASQTNPAAFNESAPNVRMPTTSAAAPRSGPSRNADVGTAPRINPAASSSAGTNPVIAVSPTPILPAPDVKIPSGNLSSRVSISPAGTQPGVPGGSPTGTPGATGGAGGGPGAPGGPGTQAASGGGAGQTVPAPGAVSVSGGKPNSTMAGPAVVPPTPETPKPSNLLAAIPPNPAVPAPQPQPATPAAPQPEPPGAVPPPPAPMMDAIDPDSTPEQMLGTKRIYTVYVNLPNTTSMTGSWVLNFSELNSMQQPANDSSELTSPVPIRKVDPKYPPTLMNSHVEGEVVLYAIIRRDGSVDSIQVLKGLEPELDQNSMEALARWKFRPATRNGVPVELEAVVHIPFRANPAL